MRLVSIMLLKMELCESSSSCWSSLPQDCEKEMSSGAKAKRLLDWERERIWNWLKDSRPLERVRISAMSSAEDISSVDET